MGKNYSGLRHQAKNSTMSEQPTFDFLDVEKAADIDTMRTAAVARWLNLTRVTLPGMAAEQGWPISEDHCFMRVCLDAVFGTPWHTVIKRPAIRHLSYRQLHAAISVAEAIVYAPETLTALNQKSLNCRQSCQPRRRRLWSDPLNLSDANDLALFPISN
jgi:hypothetical protein